MTGPPAAGAPVPGGTHAALPAPRPAPRATGPHDTRQHHGPQRPARPASATVTKHRPGLGWRWGAAEQDVSARVGPSPKAGRVWHQMRVSVRPSPAGTHGGGRWLQQPSAPPPAPSRQAASAPGPRPHAPSPMWGGPLSRPEGSGRPNASCRDTLLSEACSRWAGEDTTCLFRVRGGRRVPNPAPSSQGFHGLRPQAHPAALEGGGPGRCT